MKNKITVLRNLIFDNWFLFVINTGQRIFLVGKLSFKRIA